MLLPTEVNRMNAARVDPAAGRRRKWRATPPPCPRRHRRPMPVIGYLHPACRPSRNAANLWPAFPPVRAKRANVEEKTRRDRIIGLGGGKTNDRLPATGPLICRRPQGPTTDRGERRFGIGAKAQPRRSLSSSSAAPRAAGCATILAPDRAATSRASANFVTE